MGSSLHGLVFVMSGLYLPLLEARRAGRFPSEGADFIHNLISFREHFHSHKALSLT